MSYHPRGGYRFVLYIYIIMKIEIKNKRRSKEEGHLAQLIRRKMTQKNHGDKTKYNRNKPWHKEVDQKQ